jgi:thiamine biosynthesis protein ThiS
MNLIINGQPHITPQLGTVAELATWLELPSFGVAVELNSLVIRKADYSDTPLNDGDMLEIVRLVGGG